MNAIRVGTLFLEAEYISPYLVADIVELPASRFADTSSARSGQTYNINSGGAVADNFIAAPGSVVNLRGGTIGTNFEAAQAQVLIEDGIVGANMDAFAGTTVDVRGGTIGEDFEAHAGSIVNITGGHVERLLARAGSVVNISGGRFGVYGDDGTFYNRSLAVESGSEIHISGTDFTLNGKPIPGLESGLTVSLVFDPWPTHAYLTGNLLDGSYFETTIAQFSDFFEFANWQFEGPPTVNLTMPLTADFNQSGAVDNSDLTLWRFDYSRRARSDSNRDGNTDGQDFLEWQRQYGRASTLATMQIPEPGASTQLCLALAIVLAAATRSH